MNLIPTIRETLGLRENEEFQIKDRKGATVYYKCRFIHKDMQVNITGFWENSKNEIVGMLVKGQYEVVKLPFKPKTGEDYYFVDVSTGYVCRTTYGLGYRHDVVRIREALRVSSGNCYQTEEEAEEHVNEWMEKLYGKEWRKLYESDTND